MASFCLVQEPGGNDSHLRMPAEKDMNKTITDEYLTLQSELHKNPSYGVASLQFAPIVARIIKANNIKTIADYGAGKRRLLEGLCKEGVILEEYFPYDPVFPEYGPPKAAPLVCCIDVLEHVELEKLDAVLSDLHSITTGIGFFSVHTGPASKTLADGRNAHLIQATSVWWLPRICKFFEVVHLETHKMMGKGFWLVVKRAT